MWLTKMSKMSNSFIIRTLVCCAVSGLVTAAVHGASEAPQSRRAETAEVNSDSNDAGVSYVAEPVDIRDINALAQAREGKAGIQNKSQELTLQQCLSMALEQNYEVKIARNQQRIAQNNVTLSQFLPTVGVVASQEQDIMDSRTRYMDDGTPDAKGSYTGNVYDAELALSWTLFDGMAMFATRESQQELLRQGELNLKNSMESLVADISQQYYFIITQHRRLKAARLYLEISTLRYNQAKEKYVIGSISGLEMKQAKIDFNADSSNLVTQQEVLRNGYIQLYEMMNIPLQSKYRINDTIIPNDKLELGQLIDAAKVNNTAIQMARRGENLSALDLRIARSGRYPTLSFGAGYSFNHNQKKVAPTRFTRLYGANWGFTLSANIFSGFETRRKVRNAQIEVENSSLELKNTELNVVSNISQQYNTYLNNIIMINFEAESAESALANLEAAMEMYRLGTMSGVEFREIQRSYLEAEERRIAAIYQAKSSEIALRYLAGDMLN